VPEFPKRKAGELHERYREIMLEEQWWQEYFERVRLAKGAGPAMKMIEMSIAVKGEEGKRLIKKSEMLAAGMSEEEYQKGKGFIGGMVSFGLIIKVS